MTMKFFSQLWNITNYLTFKIYHENNLGKLTSNGMQSKHYSSMKLHKNFLWSGKADEKYKTKYLG